MSGTIAVTGANGFLGQHVCARLVSDGWVVRSLIRSGMAPANTEPTLFTGREDAAALRPLVRGCDAVVHLAGRAHVLREDAVDPLAAFRESNTVLTRELARSAAAEGVGTFLLMSSIAACSNITTTFVSDGAEAEPDTSYGVSKREAEQLLAGIAAATGMRAISMRPPMVFGESMRGNPLRLYHHVARGGPVPAVQPPARRSVMYAGNLADAVCLALTTAALHGSYCIADAGPPPSVAAFAATAARMLNRKAMLIPMPAWCVEGVLRLVGRSGIGGGVERAALALSRLTRSLVVDDSRFRRDTNFRSVVPLDEALVRTAAWYKAEHGHA